MLLMMTGNIAMIYLPGLPLWAGLAIAFAARNSAVYFTKWYPEYRKAKFATPAGPADALRLLKPVQEVEPIPRENDDESYSARLAQDFFSTIVFLAIYLITDNVVLATSVAIAGAVAQVIYARSRDRHSAT